MRLVALACAALTALACQQQPPNAPTEHAIQKTDNDNDKAQDFLNAPPNDKGPPAVNTETAPADKPAPPPSPPKGT